MACMTKICSKCDEEQPLGAFHKERSRRDGLCPVCKLCKKEYASLNKDTLIASAKAWQKANPERARIHQRAAYPKRRAAVYATNHARRARVLGNGGSFTAKEWRDMKAQVDYRCLCCGKREPQIKLTPDHVVPVNKGGTGDIANIQPLCLRCNQAKGDRHSTDYRA